MQNRPQVLPTKFRFIQLLGFRGENKSTNQEQESPVMAMFDNKSGENFAIFIEDLPQMLPTRLRFICKSGFREEDFQKSTNQKQELPVAAMFVNKSEQIEQSLQRTFHRCFLPSFGLFGQAVSEEKMLQKSTNQEQ